MAHRAGVDRCRLECRQRVARRPTQGRRRAPPSSSDHALADGRDRSSDRRASRRPRLASRSRFGESPPSALSAGVEPEQAPSKSESPPPFLLVADDVLGGFFAIDGGGRPRTISWRPSMAGLARRGSQHARRPSVFHSSVSLGQRSPDTLGRRRESVTGRATGSMDVS